MSLWSKIRGTAETVWQIGLGGPLIKNNSGVFEARNSLDNTFIILRVAEPIGTNDSVPNGDFILDNEPNSINNTYSNTISSGKVIQEKWVRTSDSSNLKTIDYTYSGSKISTEVRKFFAINGITIIAQMTLNYTYTGSILTGETVTRDI